MTPTGSWKSWRDAPVLSRLIEQLSAAAAGVVILPALNIGGSPIHGSALPTVIALALGVGALVIARWLARPSRTVAAAGLVGVTAGSWLAGEASYAWSAWAVALLIGAAAGLVVPRARPALPGLSATGAAAAVVGLAHATTGPGAAGIASALVALVAFAGAMHTSDTRAQRHWQQLVAIAALAVYGLFAASWVGATAPGVEWFGALTSHGPRDRAEVAITFDDGPDAPYTTAIAAILEQYGVRGTFFEVGKAVKKQPEVTRMLIEHGHVVGNHSYHHDAVSFLDPRYTELDEAEQVFRDEVGTCPALFRPPHGTHTPFMSHVVTDSGMTLVTWDVSARDWVATDASKLAKDILAKAKPGSIILLHDGLDGNVGADRSVVVAALPAILEGLRAKGLKPVTLDQLLGVPAYLQTCE
jgi:peptidoglycan/xylan/chitin deacetylase (PgdA/CDA1 family)